MGSRSKVPNEWQQNDPSTELFGVIDKWRSEWVTANYFFPKTYNVVYIAQKRASVRQKRAGLRHKTSKLCILSCEGNVTHDARTVLCQFCSVVRVGYTWSYTYKFVLYRRVRDINRLWPVYYKCDQYIMTSIIGPALRITSSLNSTSTLITM